MSKTYEAIMKMATCDGSEHNPRPVVIASG